MNIGWRLRVVPGKRVMTLRIANEHEGKSSKICPYLDTLAEVERLQRLSPDGTIAILVRKNQQISHLVNALKAKGIEASEERGNPLTDSPAVGRLIALLEWIEHPGDSTLGWQWNARHSRGF